MIRRVRNFLWFGILLLVAAPFTIKRLTAEADHTSHLVIAPYPTFRFRYGGGEEGTWVRTQPWWVLRGAYVTLWEVTDG